MNTYKEYCKEAFFETKLAKPQPEPYQKRVREWDASTLPNIEGSTGSALAAGRSLKKASVTLMLMFFVALIITLYWYSAFIDISESRTTLIKLRWQLIMQGIAMLILFVRTFYHLGRARTMLRGA